VVKMRTKSGIRLGASRAEDARLRKRWFCDWNNGVFSVGTQPAGIGQRQIFLVNGQRATSWDHLTV